MGYLENLPRELLFSIFDHCSFEDCKNLRATCKCFGAITAKRLFETYRIAFFQSHLDKFVELSRNPELAKCVKHFIFVGDVLPRIDSVNTFEDLIDMREPWSSFSKRFVQERVNEDSARMDGQTSSHDDYEYRMRIFSTRQDLRQAASLQYDNTPKHNLSLDEVQVHFEKYKSYRQQQLEWDPENLFKEAFSRLTNLTSVENAKHGFADNHLYFPWNKFQKDIIIGPNNWMQLMAVEVDQEEVEVIDLLKLPIHMKHTDCLLTAIGHRAAISQGTALRSLKLTNIGGQPLLDMEQYLLSLKDSNDQSSEDELQNDDSIDGSIIAIVDIDFDPQSVAARVQGLTHLTSLELDLGYSIPPQSPTTAIQSWQTRQLYREIHAILSVAPSLQVLKLKCDDDEGDWALEERPLDPEDDTVRRLNMPTLPKLHTLRLSCTATDESLVNFLNAHSKTLRSLELVDCTLNRGTWASVLRQIPNMLSLEHVYVEGLHDADYPPESGEEALFEDGLNVGNEAHPHDRAVHEFLLHGGHMPALDFDQWYEQNRQFADREMFTGGDEFHHNPQDLESDETHFS